MKKLAIITFVNLLLWSCGGGLDILGQIENPLDPASPNYVSPMTKIVSGPSEDAIVDTNSVQFQWRHAHSSLGPDSTGDYTIPARIFYSYRVNATNWSPWISGFALLSVPNPIWTFDTTSGLHSLWLNQLEDREYLFEVRMRYTPEDEEEDYPSRSFTIDALEGPAIIMTPSVVYADSGATFFMSAKIIDAVDLMGIHLKIAYDPNFQTVYSYQIKSDSSDFLLQSQADSIEAFTFVDHDSAGGLFDLNIALAGGNITGVSGSGIIVQFIFTHVGTIGESEIEILPESTLRNIYNNVTLHFTQNARIEVW